MRPFVIGIVTEGPISDDLECDAESSGPSSVCRHGSDSGTMWSIACVSTPTHHVHIRTHIPVKVFVQRERRARVLQKQREQADLYATQHIAHFALDLVLHEVAALAA